MREKRVKEQVVIKTLAFLDQIYHNCTYKEFQFSLSHWMAYFKISRSTAKVCEELKIINRVSDKMQTWVDEIPNRQMALKVIDQLLHKNKKTIHTPINPDWATIVTHLKEISDKLSISLQQNENVLKRIKTADTAKEGDLFRVDDQRLYIAGQIASGVYSQIDYTDAIDQFNERNDKIIQATDDLMNKLRNNTKI